MISYTKLLELPNNTPVRCKDGRLGLLIRCLETEAGVQVPGEDTIRWIGLESLHHLSGVGSVLIES